jgi:hypothetical protein
VNLIRDKLLTRAPFALLAALLILVPGQKADAQSTRPFQISLWDDNGSAFSSADSDIQTFAPGENQPNAPSILININAALEPSITSGSITETDPTTGKVVASSPVNWSQIVALEVDEPFSFLDKGVPLIDGDNTCEALPSKGTSLYNQLQATISTLEALAAALKKVNPTARFWVNWTAMEAYYIQKCPAPTYGGAQAFNGPYIDVVSYDNYADPFSSSAYNFIRNNLASPHQQIALIPGVFSASTTGWPSQQPWLADYFQYAATTNQAGCNLAPFATTPAGTEIITGIYDRCPVWIVMGYLALNSDGFTGILAASSSAILSAYQQEVALTPMTPTQQARARKAVPAALQLLLH